MNKLAEKLADMIEANPNCQFDIDNDVWYMVKGDAENTPDADDNDLATSNDFAYSTDWYDHSSNYGAGIAEALIVLLNRRGFNIRASAV